MHPLQLETKVMRMTKVLAQIQEINDWLGICIGAIVTTIGHDGAYCEVGMGFDAY